MFIKPQVATQQAPKKVAPAPVFTAQVPKGDPTLSYLVAATPLASGYIDRHVECKGEVNPSLRPWAVKSDDGRVVYHEPRKFGVLSLARPKNWVAYDQAVNRERRKLAETALAYIILHNPHLVAAVLHKVSAGMVQYWMRRRQQLGYQRDVEIPMTRMRNPHWAAGPVQVISIKTGRPCSPPDAPPGTYPVAWNALEKTKTYTHGETSYGRMGTRFPPEIDLGVSQNLAALHGNSIPRTLNAHDNFLRVFGHLGPADLVPVVAPDQVAKWLPDRRPDPQKNQGAFKEATELKQFWCAYSESWRRLERLERQVRPRSIFDEKTPSVRGRLDDKQGGKQEAAPTYAPGLLPMEAAPYLFNGWFRLGRDWFSNTILPIEGEARKRGIDIYRPDLSSAFMKDVNAHNLIFAAGQSGTTSTLFQSAMLFGNLTSLEDLKTYLMAILAYLVGGGMHSCHELFKTAQLVGIEYRVGEYDGAIPDHIRAHELYKKWKHEFADVVGPGRFR